MIVIFRGTLFGLAFLLSMTAHGADGDFVWARAMGGAGSDEGKAIAVDDAGNVYTTGTFEGTADFDPGAGTVNLTSAGAQDIFVQKLDPDGNFVWARHFGRGGGVWHEAVADIAVDGLDNIYTTGCFEGTVDFDPGDEVLDLTSAGRYDIFLQKLDANGSFVWTRHFGGSGIDLVTGVAVDGLGNIYTTGYFENTVDFDPGDEVFILTSVGSSDIFVQKLDADGNFLWARGMGGAHNERAVATDMAVDGAGNVYTTGHFFGTVDFDPSAETFDLNGDNYDSFVHKLDARGNFAWIRARGGSNYDWGLDIAVDGAGNVLSIARDGIYLFFDEVSGFGYSISDSVIQKHDKDGNRAWAINLGRYSGDQNTGYRAEEIAADPLGNVYIMGNFSGTMDFDPGEGIFNLTSTAGIEAFLQKLDAGGNFVWVRRIGGVVSDINPRDKSEAIAVDSAGNVYATGHFSGTKNFTPDAGMHNLTSAGLLDVFVQKLGPSAPPGRCV